MEIDVVQLPLQPYLDISKLCNDQIQLFINKLNMMQSVSDANNDGLFYVSKDQIHYIIIHEKYFNRNQRILGACYLTKSLSSHDISNLPFCQSIDFMLVLLAPNEFIDMLYNDVFNLEHSRHDFCNQLTNYIDHIFAHENHTPIAWFAAQLPKLTYLEFNYLHHQIVCN